MAGTRRLARQRWRLRSLGRPAPGLDLQGKELCEREVCAHTTEILTRFDPLRLPPDPPVPSNPISNSMPIGPMKSSGSGMYHSPHVRGVICSQILSPGLEQRSVDPDGPTVWPLPLVGSSPDPGESLCSLNRAGKSDNMSYLAVVDLCDLMGAKRR